MVEKGVYIRNVQLLEQLNDQITYSGKEMANIDAGVSNYFNSVKNDLDDQLRIIQGKLNAAEERLRSAEEALQACQAMEVVTDIVASMVGVPVNPCMAQECAVEAARIEVEKWRMRYTQGQQILGECQQEIAGYNVGGHALILNMCELQTPKASSKLHDCISKIEDILNTNVNIHSNMNVNDVSDYPGESLSQDRVFSIDRRFGKEVQVPNDAKKTDHAVRCLKCGRPILLCTCNNLHKNV
mgnify:CR=1 FL=1